MTSQLSRLGAAIAFVLAAFAFQDARDLTWGGVDLPDGTRFKVSPIGISHILEPLSAVSPTRTCRWRVLAEQPSPCALDPNAGTAGRVLRLIPLALMLGTAVCLAVAVAGISASAAARRGRGVLAMCGAVLAVMAPMLWARTVPTAVPSVRGLGLGVGGTLGTLELSVTAAVLTGFAIAAFALLQRRTTARWALALALVAVPFSAFYNMFPFWGGQAFLWGSLAFGFLVGRAAPQAGAHASATPHAALAR